MTNMKKFAAQQLTKKQMNEVKGGMGVVECIGKAYQLECTVVDSGGITRRLYSCGEANGNAILNMGKEATKLGAAVDSANCIWF